jgi:tRNA(Ile)-lysidine synthase
MTRRNRLTPSVADVRRAVRESFERHGATSGDLVLAACSGGPDSMALAAGLAFEGPKLGLRIGAVIVDHGIQEITATVAEETRTQLEALGFNPVRIVRVKVGSEGGLEAAARSARYEAIDEVAAELDAKYVLLGHTRDDQAETVLLGLARGSGARSLSGMAELTGRYLRPMLGITRETTVQACEDAGLKVWLDPHNSEDRFARVRVREQVLPVLEEQLGPGIAEALSRTADQLREDDEVLDHLAEQAYRELVKTGPTSLTADVKALAELQPAIRYRVIRLAGTTLGGHLHRSHVLEIDRLLTNWHGQKPLAVPSVRVERTGENIVFRSTKTLKPGAC